LSGNRPAFPDDVLRSGRVAVGGTIPQASPERRDEDHPGVVGIGNDAMTPLEVEAAEAEAEKPEA